MSTATLEAPVNGLVEDTDVAPELTEAEQVSMSVGNDPKLAKLEAQAAKSEDKVVRSYLDAYDGADMLGRHLKSGKMLDEHVKLCKSKIIKQWRGDDYDSVAERLSMRIAMVSAIRPRVDDDHLVYMFVEAFKDKAPKVTDVRYSHIVKVMMRPCLKFDKKEIEVTVKEGWFDFMVELINVQGGDSPKTLNEVKEAVAGHIKKLADDRKEGLTPKQREDAERAEVLRKANAARSSARKSIGDAVAKAVEARLEPTDISAVVAECGVVLPQVGPNPAKMNAADAKVFVGALVASGNVAGLMALYAETRKVIAEMQALQKAANEQAAAA